MNQNNNSSNSATSSIAEIGSTSEQGVNSTPLDLRVQPREENIQYVLGINQVIHPSGEASIHSVEVQVFGRNLDPNLGTSSATPQDPNLRSLVVHIPRYPVVEMSLPELSVDEDAAEQSTNTSSPRTQGLNSISEQQDLSTQEEARSAENGVEQPNPIQEEELIDPNRTLFASLPFRTSMTLEELDAVYLQRQLLLRERFEAQRQMMEEIEQGLQRTLEEQAELERIQQLYEQEEESVPELENVEEPNHQERQVERDGRLEERPLEDRERMVQRLIDFTNRYFNTARDELDRRLQLTNVPRLDTIRPGFEEERRQLINEGTDWSGNNEPLLREHAVSFIERASDFSLPNGGESQHGAGLSECDVESDQMVGHEHDRIASPKRAHDDNADNDGESNPPKRRLVQDNSLPTIPEAAEMIFTQHTRQELPFNRNFHRRQWETTYSLRHNLSSFADLTSISSAVDRFYTDMMQEYLDEAMPTDRITVSINHHSINPPIYINFLRKDFDPEHFSKRLKAVAQSNKDLLTDDNIAIAIRLVKNVGGQGKSARRSVAPQTASERSKSKKSVIVIHNVDNLCGLRAILLGKLLADEYDTPEKRKKSSWTTAKQSVHDGYKFRMQALEICSALNIDPQDSLKVSDLPQIQQYLGGQYHLIVVNFFNLGKIFVGPPAPKLICLEFRPGEDDSDIGHFNLITKLAAYFDRYYMCIDCWYPTNNRGHHRPNGCKQCYSNPACEKPTYPLKAVECPDCLRDFFGQQCLLNHKRNGTCQDRVKCRRCKVEFFSTDKHKCFNYNCGKCGKEYMDSPHYCYLTPLKEDNLHAEDMLPKALVFYDIEAIQKIVDGRLTHFPILLVSETVCDGCYNHERRTKDNECGICGGFQSIYYGLDCVQNFVDYVLNDLSKRIAIEKGNVLVIAHNSKGYDAHFIFRDIFSRNLTDVRPILNGNKILKIDLNNVRFLDSLSFFQQPLDSLPKTFGLDCALVAKGVFPHLFNTEENQDYVGRLPEVSYFAPELMKEKKRDEFMKWYEENKDSVWKLKEELMKYCANDVSILRMCVMDFRSLVKRMTSCDPLTRCFTLASVAMEIFRVKMLPGNFMAITPPKGYSGRHNSNEACAWLDMVEITRKIKLRREYRIGPYFVDGFCKETGEVFEYNGCFYHGCPECFVDPAKINNVSHRAMGELYDDTITKKKYLEANRYRVVSIWSHEIAELPPRCLEILNERKAYFKKLQDVGPLQQRDGFFGGRTNNIYFLYECGPDEQIKYYDFTSLYPSVLCKNMFPYGHPEVIRRDFDYTLDQYFGFVKCQILPPDDLFIPVLPAKSDGKLVFHLCSKCSEDKNQQVCTHSETERALVGTWTTAELRVAINEGYRILDIFEVHHYDKPQINIFADYIKLWLKEKQEASGYPSWVQTEEDKDRYIALYKEKEGIDLDKDKIVRNEGRRSIAKAMLNSLWGRFALRKNQTKTSLVTDYAEYWRILNDPKLQVQSEYNPTDQSVILQYKYESDDDDEEFAARNIAVPAFVTSYARMKLYELIDEIESVRAGRVLYFDTDSVIFVERDSDPKIQTGDFLGELTDELQGYGPGARCTKFSSCGPKNYGYEITMPDGQTKATIKAKGIRLSAQAMEIINFQKMLDMANKFARGEILDFKIPQFRIKTTTASHIVFSETIENIYRVVSDKRRLDGKCTLPYGYRLR